MRKRKHRSFGQPRNPLNQGRNAAERKEQMQEDYDAFKEWIASGEASKPITLDEINRMLRLVSKSK